MIRIYPQRGGALNENDRLDLARLLIKAGYKVRIGKEKMNGGRTYTYFIEYEEVRNGA
jgi:hypothetical protein|nr:MAG TPA: hypothetical protein [Caudoviricetes sp.]